MSIFNNKQQWNGQNNYQNSTWTNAGNGNGTSSGNGSNNGSGFNGEQGKKFLKLLPYIIVVVLIILLAGNCFYKVSEQEQAVVTMFGKVISIKGAGLYGRIPFIQNVTFVDTTTHGMPIGYRTEEGGTVEDESSETVEQESIMITSDFNFVDIDFYLEYRVSDPEKYLFNASNPVDILRNTAQSCIRSTVVNYTVDDVITTGKNQIQAEVREKLVDEMEKNDIGLQIVNLTVQDAEPPTSDVMQAFKEVETAKQGKETSINNAKKYQNEKLPQAEAEADKITQTAEAAKESRINEAEGQAERFVQLYAEYSKNPLITKQRMFYETMEEVLPGVKLIIDDGNTQTMLPIESFVNAGENVLESDNKDTADESATSESAGSAESPADSTTNATDKEEVAE
ncbi:MAG: FtsH protease activity modulator HflK [Lachnospiraceae bacterium]|nr:FtsH protease activity modulator HflK [Lachnospiraceae bacterium]